MNDMASARASGRTRIATAPRPSTARRPVSQPGSTSAGQRLPGASAVMRRSPLISAALDPILRIRMGHGRPERAELVRRDLAGDHAAFLGDPGEAGHDPSKLGLARGVEEEIRPPEGPPWGRGDLAVQRRVRGERPEDPLPLGPLLHRGEVVARVPLRRNRQQLERPRDRVVEGGERLEGGRALDLGHELEVHRRELEARDEAAVDTEAVVGDARDRCARGRQPVRTRTAGTRRAVDLDQPVRQHAPHERTIGVSGWSVKVNCVRLCVRAGIAQLAAGVCLVRK